MSKLSYKEMVRAMAHSDSAYDGKFYVGVHSTGIYCVPSCKAKKPKLKNVVFYGTREEAIAAGMQAVQIGEISRRFALLASRYSEIHERPPDREALAEQPGSNDRGGHLDRASVLQDAFGNDPSGLSPKAAFGLRTTAD